jgi:hypothetical protein
MSEAEWRDEARMLDRIVVARGAGERAKRSRGARPPRASMPRIALGAMASATMAIYGRAMSRPRATRHAPLSRRRVRDALGYRPWTPPAPVAQPTASSMPASATRRVPPRAFAQAALRLRQSSAGPLLRALTPGFVREALKARLK